MGKTTLYEEYHSTVSENEHHMLELLRQRGAKVTVQHDRNGAQV